MSSAVVKQSRERARHDELPAAETTRRRRRTKPAFGRDESGPASSPPPYPPRLVTPQPRRSRRVSATSTPLRLASENAVARDGHSDTESEEGSNDLFFLTPSKPSNITASKKTPIPPKLRSFVSAPAITSRDRRGSNAQRPDIRQRSASDQALVTRTAAEIDRSIAEIIMKDQEAQSDKKGYVYIFEASREDGGPVLYKVGKSITPEQRIKNIRRKCKFAALTEVVSSVSLRPLEKFAVAEKLIQEELACFKYDMPCPCRQKHGEYFLVEDKQVVFEAFRRWHTFCRGNPWGADGRLSGRWKFRLDNRPPLKGDGDHHALTGVWRQFVTPTSARGTTWAALYTLGRISPYWWQFVAFAQAMAMAPLSSMSTWAWAWALFIAFCVLLERLEIGYPWLEKQLLALLEEVDADVGRRKPVSYADSENHRDDSMLEKDDDQGLEKDDDQGLEEATNGLVVPSESADDERAHIAPPGAWKTEDDEIDNQAAGTSDSALLVYMDDHMEVGDTEGTGDEGESPLSDCSDAALPGCSRESPIVIV